MIITLRIDTNDRIATSLDFDIQNWMQWCTRDLCEITETKDFDGFKLMTFDFRHPLDAVDFQYWDGVRRYVLRT